MLVISACFGDQHTMHLVIAKVLCLCLSPPPTRRSRVCGGDLFYLNTFLCTDFGFIFFGNLITFFIQGFFWFVLQSSHLESLML